MKSELIFMEAQAFAIKIVWQDTEKRVDLLRKQIAAEQFSMSNNAVRREMPAAGGAECL